jgi:hypothetical protein
MPIGPGDDVLDAIEAGKDDNALMKDYKLNSEQVRSFRSLYYGLTNKRMRYEDINEYFPDLKTYFTPPAPTLQQTPEAPGIPKEDFTKPVKQKQIAESTALAATQPGKTGLTNQDILNNKVKAAKQNLYNELEGNNDVAERMIRVQRYEHAKQQGLDQFAEAPRTDMPAAGMLADVRDQVDPQTKPQDLPVATEEIGKLKSEIKANEPQARLFVNQIIASKPDKARQLQSDMYALDANARLEENPSNGNKVVENIKALDDDKLKYDPQRRQLVKELDFFPALVAGVKQRAESLEGYKTLQLPKEQVIKIMEARRASYDPDQPIELPKGRLGEVGQMFGTEWASLLKGTATTVASTYAGVPEAAPYISAAINSPEYYKRGFEAAFNQTYNDLRGQGKTEDDAYEGALKQARIEANYDAAEGFISSYIGGRIGIKELPKFKITGGFKNAVKEVLTKSKHFATETTVEGLTDGLIAGYLQDKKNQAARDAGMFRSDESVKEAIEGELTFALAAGAMSQAGRAAIDPNTYKKIVYWITRQPKETTDAKLGEMVINGDITQEDADNIQSEIKEQKRVDSKVRDDIKDVSRMAMIDKIKKRDELKKRLETEDEGTHPPIKEEIKKLNDEILQHSTHKKEEAEPEQTEQQPEASATDKTAPEPDAAITKGVEGTAAPVYEHRHESPGLDKAIEDVEEKELKRYNILSKRQFSKALDWKTMPKEGADRVKYLKYRNEYLDAILFKLMGHEQRHTDEWLDLTYTLEDEYETNEDELRAMGELKPKAKVAVQSTVPSVAADSTAAPVADQPGLVTEQQLEAVAGEQPGVVDQATVSEQAPVAEQPPATPNEQHWTNPTTGQQFVLRDDKLYAKMSSGEMEFSEKAMKTKDAKEIVANIKRANQPTKSDAFIEESAGSMAANAPRIKPTKKQAEFYQSNMGATPTVTGRVMPDPIVGLQPKDLRGIVNDVSVGLKQRLIYAKTGRLGGIGAYLPGFKGIKIKRNNDLDTIAHELGHAIDDHFDLYTKIAQDKKALLELDQFASHGSTPPSGHPNPRKYIDKEGFAEWMRAYIINPKAAEQMAPKVTALYKQHASKKFQEVIKQFGEDIRIREGATGADIMKTNIEFEPDKPKGTLGKLFKREETNNEFSINWVDRLAANFTNPLTAFEKAFNYAKGIRGMDEVLPENDPIILSRILLGIDGKFGEIMKTGMINGRGDVLADENGNPMNLNWLLEPFDNTTSASIKKDMEDTILFMVAQRTEELSKKFDRGEELTGIGTQTMNDFQVAQKTLNDFYNGDQNRLARIEEAAKRYRAFADATLSYAVDKGRMSQEQYEAVIEDNEQYVMLKRIMETAPGEEFTSYASPGASVASTTEILHRIEGSTKTIRNPYASLLDSLYKVMRESDRNDMLRAFRDILVDPRYSNEGEPVRYSDVGMIAAPSDTKSQTIPIFINGKKEKWIFQKDVREQLLGLDKDAFRFHNLITWPARAVRFFTTHHPAFAVRNWLRDTQDRIIKSTTGSGFASLIGSQEDWHAIARAGGLNSGHYAKSKDYYYGLLTEATKEIAKDKRFILADPSAFKRLWGGYTDLLYKGETSNRVAEYRSAFKEGKKKGMDDYNASMYAAYKSRNLIDFAIMGHWMKVINQIVPFSNAAVQGLRSAAYSAQTNPGGFLLKIFAYSIVPGIAAWIWNHRNEEDEKLYEELPGYQRDMFWNFRVSPNNWLSIPKPYELAIPQMGIDRLLSYQYAGNEKAFDGFSDQVIKLLFPFDEGNLAGPFQAIWEGKSNYDFFRERNIIPVDEDPLNLAMRNTETASRLGQVLQRLTEIEAIKYIPLIKNLADIDARKWDHFIQRQFSYTGTLALKLADLGREDSRHEFDFTDTGLFKRSPAYNSKSVQDMISYAKEFGLTKTPAYKSFNAIVGDYFNADTDEQREQIGKQLIEYGKELLKAWEEEHMDEYKIERAQQRKEARKK